MNKYIFKLYISGEKEESKLIIEKLEEIFKKQDINYRLDIVDILKNPAEAEEDKILIIPALVKVSPPPVKRIFGDLLDTKKLLPYLDLPNSGEK